MGLTKVSLASAALLAFALTAASCSSDSEPKVATAPGLTCDRDPSSPEMQTINERVGGLRNDDFHVRFAQSTRLGVITLVTGDFEKAKDELIERRKVALVAEFDDDNSGKKVIGFEQIRALLDDACPPGKA